MSGSSRSLRQLVVILLPCWLAALRMPPRAAAFARQRLLVSRQEAPVCRHPDLPPGPAEIPGLGSASFVWDNLVCGEPLPPILRRYRRQFGDVFTVKTGPIRLVWLCDDALVDEVYAREACSGRSQIKEEPFGKKFLFLVRSPVAAKPIRAEQSAWLATNAGWDQVRRAVDAAAPELYAALDAAAAGEAAPWPNEDIGVAALGALLSVFGDDVGLSLDADERRELLRALAGYRKRSSGPSNPLTSKADYGGMVRQLLIGALRRAGCTDDEALARLPLLVSACVGGGEIFPLLTQWSVRRLALEPDYQATLREEAASAGGSPRVYRAAIQAVLKQCPYSTAIGPPRKALDDIELPTGRGTIPKGSL
eukprot:6406977-Prymnesium_polylepis.2